MFLVNFSHSETQNVFNLPVRAAFRDGIMYDDGNHLLQSLVSDCDCFLWKQSQSDTRKVRMRSSA